MTTNASAIIFEERPQTLGEEIANAISHGLGFLLAIASLPILVVMAVRHGTATNIVAVSIVSRGPSNTKLAPAASAWLALCITYSWLTSE